MRELKGVLKSGWIEMVFQVFRKEVLRLWKHSVRWSYHVLHGLLSLGWDSHNAICLSQNRHVYMYNRSSFLAGGGRLEWT